MASDVASSISSSFKIDKLTEENYDTWSFMMKMLLCREGLWSVATESRPLVVDADYLAKEQQALQVIALSCDSNQVVYLRKCTTGKAAWDMLKSVHQQSTIGAQIRIMKQLFSSKLPPNGSMREHLNRLFTWFDKLGEMDAGLTCKVSVSVILASLNEEYEHLVTAIEAWDETRLTVQNVKAKLIDEWEKKSGGSEYPTTSTALKTKPIFTCYGCGQPGHMKRNCPDLRRVLKQLRKEKDENKETDDEASAKVVRLSKWYTRLSMHKEKGFHGWIIDSGATCHMCADVNQFVSLDYSNVGKIMLADGRKIDSLGIGNVKLEVLRGEKAVQVELSGVLYAPELDGNLISVRSLTEKGFVVEFLRKECKLSRDGYSWKVADWTNNMYELCQLEKCSTASAGRRIELCVHEWHRRLAHRNLKDVRAMEHEGLKIRNCECSDICEPCLKGKMARKSFPKKATPVSKALDCIVSDVCGPMQIQTVSGKRYFVTFTDVFSGYTEVVLMRQKSEVTDKTIEFIEKLKTQTNRKPKIFRSDRGGEYTNEKLQSYFKKEGVLYQYTLRYTPQQNGIAERKNRTLVEGVRTMLVGSGLPKTFWGEAVCTIAYTNNRILHEKSEKTPFELMFGRKPDSRDFHEFGCDAYVMIPYEKRRKLDDKSRKMKFVGYDEQSKAYRFVDENYKITLSRDVQFLHSKESFKGVEPDADDFDVTFVEHEFEEVFYDSLEEQEHEHVEERRVDVKVDVNPAEERDQEGAQLILNPENQPELRRSGRERQLPARLRNDYILYEAVKCDSVEPRNFCEAMESEEREEWMEAMNEELSSIQTNDTWELCDLPAGRKPVGSKWVFKNKRDENGKLTRRKARLVAQGFSQKYGVDYDEVFAPVVRSATIRLMLSVAGSRRFSVRHFDIKTAFLNGELSEEIYLKQPPGFEKGDKVLKLKKSLYGLKQAAKVWNDTLHGSLMNAGCTQSQIDKCLYSLRSDGSTCYILIHVDDLLVATDDNSLMSELIAKIEGEFELKDLGEVKNYLGIQVSRDEVGNFSLTQSNYIDQIVESADLKDAKVSKIPMDTGYYKLEGKLLTSNEMYRKLIGMLLYVSTNTRPDIAACVGILSQRIAKPRDVDMNEVKRLIRYLNGTKFMKLTLSSGEKENAVCAFSDSDWAENREDRKSNSGYCILVNGGMISWSSRKQEVIALSSTEAEYVALTETCKEVTWCREIMKDLDVLLPESITVYTDSQSCINMIENRKFSNRTKHIDIKYHYVREQAANKSVDLVYISTHENIADMLTKPLASVKLVDLSEKAGLKLIK